MILVCLLCCNMFSCEWRSSRLVFWLVCFTVLRCISVDVFSPWLLVQASSRLSDLRTMPRQQRPQMKHDETLYKLYTVSLWDGSLFGCGMCSHVLWCWNTCNNLKESQRTIEIIETCWDSGRGWTLSRTKAGNWKDVSDVSWISDRMCFYVCCAEVQTVNSLGLQHLWTVPRLWFCLHLFLAATQHLLGIAALVSLRCKVLPGLVRGHFGMSLRFGHITKSRTWDTPRNLQGTGSLDCLDVFFSFCPCPSLIFTVELRWTEAPPMDESHEWCS